MGKIKLAFLTYLACLPFSFISAFNFDNTCFAGPIEDPESYLFEIPRRNYVIYQNVVDKNQVFGNILDDCNVENKTCHTIIEKCQGVFNVNSLKAGKPYTIFAREEDDVPDYMVYEPSKTEYIIFDFRADGKVFLTQKHLSRKERAAAGEINSSLYMTLDAMQVSPKIAVELADVYAWTVDFFKIQKGDKFKVIFEEVFADGEFVETGKIKAASFTHNGEEIFSYFFQSNEKANGGYYDEKGNSVKRPFLKAPVKFSRISSRYNKHRFHPVLRRVKAHLGTDYAAPQGTPIMSTADGTVVEAGRNRGNGNYVKIKHNKTYTTQYLHMSKFAKGIKKGKSVKQGEVIGYVGSTGLATGPHVCYRFWKNGVQIDPLREKITISKPLDKKYLKTYLQHIEKYKAQLEQLEYQSQPEEKPSPELLEIS